jgi:predicted nucleic acid-binding protein
MELVDKAVDANCVLTLQSLSEFYSVATRRRIMAADRAASLVRQWLSLFSAVAASATAIRTALDYTAAGSASYWDALLVATAEEAGCSVALTEDMADGSVLGGVQIHNPFARSGGLTERTQTLLGL